MGAMSAPREGEARWDGLRSREAGARDSAWEHIRQAVLRKSEALALARGRPAPPAADRPPPPPPAAPAPSAGLNEMLARLLMLSKRCPFRDVREKSEALLRTVQVKM